MSIATATLTINRMRRHFYEFRRKWPALNLPPNLAWYVGHETLREFYEDARGHMEVQMYADLNTESRPTFMGLPVYAGSRGTK